MERVRLGIPSKDDIKYIQKMRLNTVDEKTCVFMCAKNKDVDEINKNYFEENTNNPILFKQNLQYHIGRVNVDRLPYENNKEVQL